MLALFRGVLMLESVTARAKHNHWVLDTLVGTTLLWTPMVYGILGRQKSGENANRTRGPCTSTHILTTVALSRGNELS